MLTVWASMPGQVPITALWQPPAAHNLYRLGLHSGQWAAKSQQRAWNMNEENKKFSFTRVALKANFYQFQSASRVGESARHNEAFAEGFECQVASTPDLVR